MSPVREVPLAAACRATGSSVACDGAVFDFGSSLFEGPAAARADIEAARPPQFSDVGVIER